MNDSTPITLHQQASADATNDALPSIGRLLTLAILLPAAVAGTDQLLFHSISSSTWLRSWLYPGLALTTAILSWCVGRYLYPAWLSWLVFAWSLALLNLLTFASCTSGPLPYHFGYVLVSAQISLLTVWAILSRVDWRWRLPGVLMGTAALILSAANFGGLYFGAPGWLAMMVLVAIVVVVLCIALRLYRFALQKQWAKPANGNKPDLLRANQFGLKHLFIWATAMIPLLLVTRGLDLFLMARLDIEVTFTIALAAISIATVNLVALWAVLGSGSWNLRVAILLLASILTATGLANYFAYLDSKYAGWPAGSILHTLVREDWNVWLWGQTLLMAALLLFVRSSGYRLVRSS